MAVPIRSIDWALRWSQSLLTSVSILPHARVPVFMWWGSSLVQFQNDAHRPMRGYHGHPRAMSE